MNVKPFLCELWPVLEAGKPPGEQAGLFCIKKQAGETRLSGLRIYFADHFLAGFPAPGCSGAGISAFSLVTVRVEPPET